MEKRRYPRLSVNLPVILRHNGRFIPATMLNISCGGMHIKVEDEDVSKTSSVEIIFDLNEGQRDLSVNGQIRHAENADDSIDIGVQFSNLFSNSHKAIQSYLNRNLN